MNVRSLYLVALLSTVSVHAAVDDYWRPVNDTMTDYLGTAEYTNKIIVGGAVLVYPVYRGAKWLWEYRQHQKALTALTHAHDHFDGLIYGDKVFKSNSPATTEEQLLLHWFTQAAYEYPTGLEPIIFNESAVANGTELFAPIKGYERIQKFFVESLSAIKWELLELEKYQHLAARYQATQKEIAQLTKNLESLSHSFQLCRAHADYVVAKVNMSPYLRIYRKNLGLVALKGAFASYAHHHNTTIGAIYSSVAGTVTELHSDLNILENKLKNKINTQFTTELISSLLSQLQALEAVLRPIAHHERVKEEVIKIRLRYRFIFEREYRFIIEDIRTNNPHHYEYPISRFMDDCTRDLNHLHDLMAELPASDLNTELRAEVQEVKEQLAQAQEQVAATPEYHEEARVKGERRRQAEADRRRREMAEAALRATVEAVKIGGDIAEASAKTKRSKTKSVSVDTKTISTSAQTATAVLEAPAKTLQNNDSTKNVAQAIGNLLEVRKRDDK